MWVIANSMTSGKGSNIGIASYSNGALTLAYLVLPVSLHIAEGASNWNLLGNTSPAYIDVTILIMDNVVTEL